MKYQAICCPFAPCGPRLRSTPRGRSYARPGGPTTSFGTFPLNASTLDALISRTTSLGGTVAFEEHEKSPQRRFGPRTLLQLARSGGRQQTGMLPSMRVAEPGAELIVRFRRQPPPNGALSLRDANERKDGEVSACWRRTFWCAVRERRSPWPSVPSPSS